MPLRFATGRHITGFASLGASHASPLHAPHAKTYCPRLKPHIKAPPNLGGVGEVSRKPSLPEAKTHKSWFREPRKPTNPANPKISLIRDSDNRVRCMEGRSVRSTERSEARNAPTRSEA